jgi:hypothetical protein
MGKYCNECGRGAQTPCPCGMAVYCSRKCQKRSWPSHKVHCTTESPDSSAIGRNLGDPESQPPWTPSAGIPNSMVALYKAPPDGKFTLIPEYRNIFEALADLEDTDGKKIFDWYTDIVLGSDFYEEFEDATDNFTGFIPDNAAIAAWASDIGIAVPESEFNGDVDNLTSLYRGETVKRIRENRELRLIFIGHMTPDLLPPTRGTEGLPFKAFGGIANLPRNEALEPLGVTRENDLDVLKTLEGNAAFMRRYGGLEIRKVQDDEIADRRKRFDNPDLSQFRVKFTEQSYSSNIVFSAAWTFRTQNAYIYRTDKVLGKPFGFFKREERQELPTAVGSGLR